MRELLYFASKKINQKSRNSFASLVTHCLDIITNGLHRTKKSAITEKLWCHDKFLIEIALFGPKFVSQNTNTKLL